MKCQGPTQISHSTLFRAQLNPPLLNSISLQPRFSAAAASPEVKEFKPHSGLGAKALSWLGLPVIFPLYFFVDFMVPTMTWFSPEYRDRLEYLLPNRFHSKDLYILLHVQESERLRKAGQKSASC